MREKKYYIAIDGYERDIIIDSLNRLKNKLISECRYTDNVDKILLKVANAKQKKFKIIMQDD